eukprot:TRINITY_DN4182_c0_g1_i1.p3 TRINITY_DN4182_c0_g1~~TRINITY_DN4182_c0_g1_i1.p3  ORF type:complete len:55 (+),score=1.18 TRINITY_DN4182_c0_g1_i1:490-654(+)
MANRLQQAAGLPGAFRAIGSPNIECSGLYLRVLVFGVMEVSQANFEDGAFADFH